MKWITEHFRDRNKRNTEWKEPGTEWCKGQSAAKYTKTGSKEGRTSALVVGKLARNGMQQDG